MLGGGAQPSVVTPGHLCLVCPPLAGTDRPRPLQLLERCLDGHKCCAGEDCFPARRISASERPLQAGLWFAHGFAFWPKVLVFVFINGRWSYFGPRTRFAVIYK